MSHITFAERSLLLRCLWNVGLPLQSKPGNQLSSQNHMGYMELSSSCCAEIGVPLDCETGVPGNLWSCLEEVKPLVVYVVECGMALEQRQGKQASSRVALGYTEIFIVPVVTSGSF